MDTDLSAGRFPILTFTLIGALWLFANNALISVQQNLAGGPHHHLAAILTQTWNLIGPGLWLLIIALCFLLTSGHMKPTWTIGRWPLAVATLYLFHVPLMFAPLTILGRWSFALFLFLASAGTVCAMWLLMRHFHVAAFFILAEPLVRTISWLHMHHGTRSVVMKLFAMVEFLLIGWWFRDTVASQMAETTLEPTSPTISGADSRF